MSTVRPGGVMDTALDLQMKGHGSIHGCSASSYYPWALGKLFTLVPLSPSSKFGTGQGVGM